MSKFCRPQAKADPVPLTRRDLNAFASRLAQPDHFTNFLFLFLEYGILGATVLVSVMGYRWTRSHGWSGVWWFPVYSLAVVVIGAVQHRLSNLTHEAAHYALFRNRLLNELISDLFCIFPLGATTHNFRVSHWGHHAFTNDPHRDPDLVRLRSHQDYRFPMAKTRFVWLYLILQVLPVQSLRYLWGRAKIAVLGIHDTQAAETEPVYGTTVTALMRTVFYGAAMAVLTWQGWWLELFLYWLIPLGVTYPLFMLLREIAHHTNVPGKTTFENSRIFTGSWFVNFAVFPYGQAYHLPHHLFPTVPHYRLAKVHEAALGYPLYADNLAVCNGFFFKKDKGSDLPTVLDLLANPA